MKIKKYTDLEFLKDLIYVFVNNLHDEYSIEYFDLFKVFNENIKNIRTKIWIVFLTDEKNYIKLKYILSYWKKNKV